jgi:hypothetical protein
VLGLVLTRVTQHYQKLVSADTDDRFFGTDMPHEEAGHLHQDTVALGVTVGVVVLLEVVDVEIDAAPLSLWLRLALARDGVQIPAIVAAGKRIPYAELEQLGLQLLALSDVDENSVTVLLAGFAIDREEGAVGNRSDFSVTPCQLKLEVPHGAIALQLGHLPGPYLGPDEIARARSLQLFQRFHAKHFEKSGVRVDDLPVHGRDVNSFLQAQCQLTERVGIAQVPETFLFFGLSDGLGTTHITASANGIAVALMEGSRLEILWHPDESRNKVSPVRSRLMVIPVHAPDSPTPKMFRRTPLNTRAVTAGRAVLPVRAATSARFRRKAKQESGR